ncbi:hypothetical protein A8L50_23095 [Pantoea ananatis]|nr:hypothetical protein [Pantoea ananatis]NQE82200.1 hypothetical protein [Pantoea ananatis]
MKTVGIIMSQERKRSGDLFILRNLLHLFIHDFTGDTNALTALLTHGYDLAKLLNRFRLVAAHDFTEDLITNGIAQTDVHFFITQSISCSQCKCESFLFQTYPL